MKRFIKRLIITVFCLCLSMISYAQSKVWHTKNKKFYEEIKTDTLQGSVSTISSDCHRFMLVLSNKDTLVTDNHCPGTSRVFDKDVNLVHLFDNVFIIDKRVVVKIKRNDDFESYMDYLYMDYRKPRHYSLCDHCSHYSHVSHYSSR